MVQSIYREGYLKKNRKNEFTVQGQGPNGPNWAEDRELSLVFLPHLWNPAHCNQSITLWDAGKRNKLRWGMQLVTWVQSWAQSQRSGITRHGLAYKNMSATKSNYWINILLSAIWEVSLALGPTYDPRIKCWFLHYNVLSSIEQICILIPRA